MPPPGVSDSAVRRGGRVGQPWRLTSRNDVPHADVGETELVQLRLDQIVHPLLWKTTGERPSPHKYIQRRQRTDERRRARLRLSWAAAPGGGGDRSPAIIS